MNSKKGSLLGVIPMLILLISSSLFAVQSISIANAMADEVTESVENIGKVVEGSSSSGRYFYDHLTKGASYSINQKSYDLGQEGGGMEWTAQELEVLTTAQVILHNRANTYFTENYIQEGLAGYNCGINNQEFNILLPSPRYQVNQGRNHIAGSVVSNTAEVKTNCQFDNSGLQQQATEGFYRARYNSSFNRYFRLVKETSSIYKDLRTAWNSASVEYTASTDACGSYPSEDQVEEQARQQAFNEFEDRLQDVEASNPELDGADLTLEIKEIDYEVTDVSETTGSCCNEGNPYCAEQEDETEDGSDSSDGDGGGQGDFGEELGGDPAGQDGSDSGSDSNFDDGSTSSGGLFFRSLPSFFGDDSDRTADSGDSSSGDSSDGTRDVTGLDQDENRIQGAYLKNTQYLEPGPVCGPDCIDCRTPCNAYTHTTEVTIEVNEVYAESTLTDNKYKVMTENGWQNLEFKVDNYNQELGSNIIDENFDFFDLEWSFGQTSMVFSSLMMEDAMTQEAETWYEEKEKVFEGNRWDIEVYDDSADSEYNSIWGSEDSQQSGSIGEASRFQIQLGEKKNLPDSTDSIYFFDQQRGFFNNLFFRTRSGTSGSSLESCEGSVINGRPLTSFTSSNGKCSYSGVGNFGSGDKTIGICHYQESEETAYLVVFDGSATSPELEEACSTESAPSDQEEQSSDDDTTTGSSSGDNFIYVTAGQIQQQNQKAEGGGNVYSSQKQDLISRADNSLNSGMRSVTDDGNGHQFKQDVNGRHDYISATDMGDKARNCGLAYQFTGKDRYAECAVDTIHHWALADDTYMKPTVNQDSAVTIENQITIPNFMYAAALTRGHSAWTKYDGSKPWESGAETDAEAAFAEWVRDRHSTFDGEGDIGYCQSNNQWIWRIQDRAASAAYLNDDDLMNTAKQMYRGEARKCEDGRQRPWTDYRESDSAHTYQGSANPSENGYFRSELARSEAFGYHYYNLKAHALATLIFENYDGTDLWSYNAPTDSTSGPSLRKAFNWQEEYVEDPSSWKWNDGSVNGVADASATFELAQYRWGGFDGAVNVRGRENWERRILGPVTLTHGTQ